MSGKEFEKFKKVMEARGYKLCDRAGTIQRENYYFYKGFARDYRKGESKHGYQVLFLVYDWRQFAGSVFDDYGIAPLIITQSNKWPRIDLELTIDKFDVKDVEQYAEDFYFQFVKVYDEK